MQAGASGIGSACFIFCFSEMANSSTEASKGVSNVTKQSHGTIILTANRWYCVAVVTQHGDQN